LQEKFLLTKIPGLEKKGLNFAGGAEAAGGTRLAASLVTTDEGGAS
jgi:hypothetical protein